MSAIEQELRVQLSRALDLAEASSAQCQEALRTGIELRNKLKAAYAVIAQVEKRCASHRMRMRAGYCKEGDSARSLAREVIALDLKPKPMPEALR